MRVLIVAPVPPPYGGMALQAQQLVKLLRHDGVDVRLFASNFTLPRAIEPLGRVPALRTALRGALIWWKLWPAVRAVDVVHVMAASWWYFFLVVYPAVAVGRLARRRIVVNYRGGEAREFFARFAWLAAPVFRLATSVTAPSAFLGDVIHGRFGVEVSIVRNVLDLSLFPYRERTAFRPRLLVTRHLEQMYDVESVLRAVRAIAGRHPDATLAIAGSGPEEKRLRQLVSSWNLGNVRFLGAVPHAELPAVYADCDIYVNGSRVDNFPGALLEASAAGLALVTTGAGGIPYIYEDRRTALLVEPGDWQGLARAVEDVLADPSAAVQMTRAAAEAVRACEWSQVRAALFASYGFSMERASANALEGAGCAAG